MREPTSAAKTPASSKTSRLRPATRQRSHDDERIRDEAPLPAPSRKNPDKCDARRPSAHPVRDPSTTDSRCRRASCNLSRCTPLHEKPLHAELAIPQCIPRPSPPGVSHDNLGDRDASAPSATDCDSDERPDRDSLHAPQTMPANLGDTPRTASPHDRIAILRRIAFPASRARIPMSTMHAIPRCPLATLPP